MSLISASDDQDAECLDPAVYAALLPRLQQMRLQQKLEAATILQITENVKTAAIHTVSTTDFIAKLMAVTPCLSPDQQQSLQSLCDELIEMNHRLLAEAHQRARTDLANVSLPPPPPKKESGLRQQWEEIKQESGWNELKRMWRR